MARIKQPVSEDKEALFRMANLFWKTCIAEGVTPREFAERGLRPRPDLIESFMRVMTVGFNPDGAGATKAVIQFNFSGDAEGSCHFRVEDGTIEVRPGPAQNPTLTIESPLQVWIDIMSGKADGQQMFMEQKYKVHGDFSLLLRMKQLFGNSNVHRA
jgi:putative sterol carrier protein